MKLYLDDILSEYSNHWNLLVKQVRSGKNINILNLSEKYLGCFLSILSQEKLIILTSDQIVARNIHEELKLWGLENVLIPCSWSQIDREDLDSSSFFLAEMQKQNKGLAVVSLEEWEAGWGYEYLPRVRIENGKKYNFTYLSRDLVDRGYVRVARCRRPGEYNQIGDNWLIWPMGEKQGYRLEFDGDNLINTVEIDLLSGEIIKKISKFDIYSQLNSLTQNEGSSEKLLSVLAPNNVVTVGLDQSTARNIQKKYAEARYVSVNDEAYGSAVKIIWPMQSWGMAGSGQEFFENTIKKYRLKKNLVITNYGEEFRKWIHDLNLNFNNFLIKTGSIPEGGLLPEEGVGIWSDRELFGVSMRKLTNTKPTKINFRKLLELKVGEFVVHADHGIGILKDFTTRVINGIKKDYLVIAYNGGDLLYVPVEQLNKVSKYIGSKLIRLDRLGGSIWGKRKRKAQKYVEEMAKELLRLYAKRKLIQRSPYKASAAMEEKLENSFEYDLTEDQELALKEINDDLSQNYPMDRLLCGDVGFGKTELAIRAAARVATNGKQVAVMVPTTILAEQHIFTFRDRLQGINAKVEVISRLRDKQYQLKVLDDLKKGKIDILIGTHRLLQGDVEFKDLGLLIIDEEQKFGVRAKEKLKKIRQNIDVLSMSATPIPRTLNMSLGGVRDLSVLEIPPEGRRSIHTEVLPYSDGIIKEVLEREIGRGGQVFIVHNRVRTIKEYEKNLQEIIGNKWKIGIAHGKMSEKDLVDTMSNFAKGEYQILLATTIVENGLDLPNVNSLIVENAAGLGLAQLYQLRGRVGRSTRKAYAYFLYRSEKLKSKAKQRLDAISQATQLGSGMKLAVADMEIRGVGNVLGLQQHGNAYAVGLGMFLDMLSDMVTKLKTEDDQQDLFIQDEVVVDLPVSVSIPSYYIDDKQERLYWEHRFSIQSDDEGISKVVKEIIEKYGALPPEAEKLVKLMQIRRKAGQMGIVLINFHKTVQGLSDERKFLCLTFKDEISLQWVQYLFSQGKEWLFKEKEALMEIKEIDDNKWFDWFYKLIMNK